MFLHSPVLDVCLFLACLQLFRVFVLVDETANEEVKLLTKHIKLWIRLVSWICVFGSIIYMTLTDFAMIDGRYYVECIHIPFVAFYLMGIYCNFVSWKYGPKDKVYREKNLFQLEAIIVLTLLMAFIVFSL